MKYSSTTVCLAGLLSFFDLATAQTPNNYGVQVGYGYSVGSTIIKGDTMFVGGDFDYVGFNTSSLVEVDPGSAQVNESFPFFNGAIRTMISDGNGGYYVGGDFTTVNGYKRAGLAHVNKDKTVDLDWNVNVNDDAGVYSLLLSISKDTLWVGGNFSAIGGINKDKVAAIKVSDRNVISTWGPGTISKNWWTPSAVVCALAWYPGAGADPAKLFIGGDFSAINWQNKGSLAALNPATGTLINSWRGDLTPCNSTTTFTPVSPVVRTLVVTDQVGSPIPKLYVGGLFTKYTDNTGSFARHSLAATDVRANGAFYANCTANITPQNDSGIVNCLKLVKTPYGTTLGVAGKFRDIRNDGFASGTQNFALMASGGFSTYYVPFDKVNGHVLDTTLMPGKYASGEVFTFDTLGSNVILGGNFEGVMGKDGVVQVRRNLAMLDMTNNNFRSWFPIMQTNMPIRSVIVAGGEIVVAGSFCSAGGALRRNIAAVNLDKKLILPFNPKPDSYVNDLELSVTSDTLYIGGNFTNIGTSQRGYIAAFKMSTLFLLPWADITSAGGGVEDLKLDPQRNILYAGGKFTQIGGEMRNHLAALNALTGNVINSWQFDVTTIDGQITPVRSIALSPTGDTVFVGGRFNTIAGQPRSNLAALTTKMTMGADDATATLLPWNFPVMHTAATPDIGVNSVVVYNGHLFIGGKFSGVAGNPDMQNLAAINISSSPSVMDASWHPLVEYGGVNCIVPVGSVLYIGGDFGTVNGAVTGNAAAINIADGSTITAWKPFPNKLPYGSTILSMIVENPYVYVGGNQDYMTENVNDAVFHLATVQVIGGVLPETVEYFTAKKLELSCRLEWKTGIAAETLALERSSDGAHFTALARCMPGQTNYTDTRVENGSTYYYRLRINAGAATFYSTVRRVSFDGKNITTIPVYMISSHTLRVITPQDGCLLQLYNTAGQFISSSKLNSGINTIFVNNLSKGVYPYTITRVGSQYNGKLLVQ